MAEATPGRHGKRRPHAALGSGQGPQGAEVGKAAGGLIIDCKYGNELPKPPVPKLLKALPTVERLCQYQPTSLELDHRPFLLSEQELLSRVEFVDPDAYGAPPGGSMPPPPPPQDAVLLKDDDVSTVAKEAEAKRRRLTEKTEAWHRQAFGLQLPQLITNDVFTERQRYTTGMEAAEKKLRRNPPGFGSVEELAGKIEATFAAASEPPVHPSMPSMKPKRVLPIVPDAVLWANKYRQVVFDELPPETATNDLLFRSAPTPRITCFGYFSPIADGETGSYRQTQQYYWDNRGGFTRQVDCGEGDALLLSFPQDDQPQGEVRFVPVPTYMKLRKQKAYRLDLTNDTQALAVTFREPSAQEAQEEQERMNVVLSDVVLRDHSEASLDFIDGEWQIRGDPRSASGHSRQAGSGAPSSEGGGPPLPIAAGPA